MLNLWLRFFLPTHCTHGPGEDPFEAVMCAVGAASQISECLWRMLFLIQNITCYLCRNLFEKIFVKRYTVWEIFRDQFGKKTIFSHDGKVFRRRNVFSHTMGRCFEEEMYYVASSKSYFLEWGYWPVGGSFHNYDGDDFKAYFVCFSY